MKISDSQLETLLLSAFDKLDKTKEVCKVVISQCLQLYSYGNSIVRACLETIDTTDLCKLFIINRSPNTKSCIGFTLKVLKTNIEECKKMKEVSCKNTLELCVKILTDTHKTLKKLYDSI